MILEGIVTTVNADGSVNVAPMGPRVDESMSQFVLRPYRSSATYRNLKRTRAGVFHVTDDVEMLARAAIDRWDVPPSLRPAEVVEGWLLETACRWYAFKVVSLADASDRTTIECRTVTQGRLRDFFGFNRAKHAVVEAAILATRIGLLPADEILGEYRRLAVIVEKTAGAQERRAFALLREHVEAQLGC